jgi:hypothetical protein
MNHLPKLAGLLALIPLAIGCAARSAPFDQMDRAQITVLRLSQPPPQPQPGAGVPGLPGLPGLPIPPQAMQAGQQILQGLQNALPGVIPNIPGMPQPQAQQQLPQFKGFGIVGQMPVSDAGLRDELLDIFGHEGNFAGQPQPCFSPGMGVVFSRPNGPEVDLLVSLSCNQVKMDGDRWPHPGNAFTPETRDHLAKIYEKLWGPVPSGA